MHYSFGKAASSIALVSLPLITCMESTLAGPDPYLGEINYVAFNYAPRGWVPCDGQLLSVSQNTALYALLGTAYGGDGRTTFGVPDLRGRVPIHMGRGPGLTEYRLGFKGGMEGARLAVQQLPAHSHQAVAQSTSTSAVSGGSVSSTLNVSKDTDGSVAPGSGTVLGKSAGRNPLYANTAPSVNYVSLSSDSITTTLNNLTIATTTDTAVSVQNTGEGELFSIVQPYQVVNCIISTAGTFPPRQ